MKFILSSVSAVAALGAQVRVLSVPAWTFMVAFIGGMTCFHIWVHYAALGTFNANQIAIAFFLTINLLVNFWEIGLLVCADEVRDEYHAIKDAYRGREAVRIGEVFRTRIPVFDLLSFRRWTGLWSGYALFDPGYASRSSFGFNIDGINGISTPIFATLFAFGMTFELVPPQILGIIGIAMFWQMFYGTVVYFFQFFNSGRHRGHSPRSIAILIGSSNGLWFVFPIWGIVLSVSLILTNSYSVFR